MLYEGDSDAATDKSLLQRRTPRNPDELTPTPGSRMLFEVIVPEDTSTDAAYSWTINDEEPVTRTHAGLRGGNA